MDDLIRAFGAVVFVAFFAALAACRPVEGPSLPDPGPNGVEVEISTDPPGAKIVVDGIPVGVSPKKVGLQPGNHRFKAMKTGYFPAEKRVLVGDAGEKGPIFMKLVASH
jgi:hypothetical protein